jgi:hypothetical protein
MAQSRAPAFVSQYRIEAAGPLSPAMSRLILLTLVASVAVLIVGAAFTHQWGKRHVHMATSGSYSELLPRLWTQISDCRDQSDCWTPQTG